MAHVKDAYTFLHDANARNDGKMLQLRAAHGLQGYGFYFCLLELMREASDYKLHERFTAGYALSLGLEPEMFGSLLGGCVDSGLLCTENGAIWSPSFLLRMQVYDLKRQKLRANALQKQSKSSANVYIEQEQEQESNEGECERETEQLKLRPFQQPDARGNPRKQHPKFPALFFSDLEIETIESRLTKSGLLKENHLHAYMKVEQWFLETPKGRKAYPGSSNHMRRVIDWGLKAALELQRSSDSAKLANGRLR